MTIVFRKELHLSFISKLFLEFQLFFKSPNVSNVLSISFFLFVTAAASAGGGRKGRNEEMYMCVYIKKDESQHKTNDKKNKKAYKKISTPRIENNKFSKTMTKKESFYC